MNVSLWKLGWRQIGNNGFKMAWGRVKGKDANIGEVIRETVLL